MKIVGCDLHTRYQQIAMLDEETGELSERRLEHANGEAKEFYTQLAGPVRVGIEATGHTRWFERLLGELGHELWVGDAARIRACAVRKQKTDARDAAQLLELLLIARFRMLGDRIDGWWSRTPPRDSESGPWSMSKKQKQKPLRRESKTLKGPRVS
jgi:transposase